MIKFQKRYEEMKKKAAEISERLRKFNWWIESKPFKLEEKNKLNEALKQTKYQIEFIESECRYLMQSANRIEKEILKVFGDNDLYELKMDFSNFNEALEKWGS